MTTLRRLLGLAALVVVAAFTSADAQSRKPLTGPTFLPVGAQANAWSAAAVGVSGTSTAVDCAGQPFVSAFGNTSAAATLTVQYSQNGTTYYSSSVNTGAVTGDFGINFTAGARYIRLISNAAATITASIACKS